MRLKIPKLRVKWYYSCNKCLNEPLFINAKEFNAHFMNLHVLTNSRKKTKKNWLYGCINCPKPKGSTGYPNKASLLLHAKNEHRTHVSKQK